MFTAHRHLNHLKRFYVLIMLVGLTHCSSILTQPLVPQVQVHSLNITELGLLKQKYKLTLQIANPNPFPLPIHRLNYQLYLHDKRFTQGESEKAITVPALGETTLTLNFMSNLLEIVEQWQDWKAILAQDLNYRLVGDIQLVNATPTIPFEYQDTLSLTRQRH